jgi:hypothetical protein
MSRAFFIATGGGVCSGRGVVTSSDLGAQNFADFAVDVSGVLGGVFDQVHPILARSLERQLAEEVGGLHNGFDGVAQVMRQGAQAADDFRGKFLRVRHFLIRGTGSRIGYDCTC